MSHTKVIENYGQDVDDFEVSPFESVNMLHTRTKIEKQIKNLTNEEKIKLYAYDMVLIQNANKMMNHIEEIYDFSASSKPLNEWWWHLDKVSNGEISFNLSTNSQSNEVV